MKIKKAAAFILAGIIFCGIIPFVSANSGLMGTADDLADKRIGVATASVQDIYSTEHYPNADIHRFGTSADFVAALKADRVDAVMGAYTALREIQRRDSSLVFLAEKINPRPVGVAFQKGDAMLDSFNDFLGQIKADGTLDDMVARYFTDGNYEMPEIASVNQNGRLLYGLTTIAGVPYASISDGSYIGIEVELARRFAAFMGMELVVRDTDFSGIIASLAAGRVQMIGGGLAITEERQQMVNFSDPVYMEYSAVLIKRDKMDFSAASQYNGEETVPAAAIGPSDEKTFLERAKESFYRNLVLERRYMLVLNGLLATVALSLLALVFGTLLGGLICAMRMAGNTAVRGIAKVYISILRGIPVLVVLMVLYYIAFASVDIDTFLVAAIAFGMNFAAYVAEMFRAGIESVDKTQREAGIAGGFSPFQTFIYIIMPQAAALVLPVYKGEFISLVKMTSVVGYIAVQDLTKAGDIIRSRTMEAFFPLIMVAVLYFAISWLLSLSLTYIEKRTDPKKLCS
ncbi:MAG: ABC transporter substrate-binding protein/permease [Oscillospiraceae bacterium]|nr:ABC transporter substrate-binding protein/permease [Oscillospiraceae bacterium]